jgi:hypothetical protein
MADERHEIAVATGSEAQHTEAVFGIVIGHPFNKTGERFLGDRCGWRWRHGHQTAARNVDHRLYQRSLQLLPNRPPRAALTKFKVIPSLFSAVNCKKQNRGSQAWSARICQGQQRQLEGSSLQSTAMEQPT